MSSSVQGKNSKRPGAFIFVSAMGCPTSPHFNRWASLNMLQELARVFLCLGAGEVLSRTGLLPFPGSVIGLLLLFANLVVLGRLPEALGKLADSVLGLLGMLFVPAGVGVLSYANLLKTEVVPILAAVVGGTVVTLGVTVLVADRLSRAKAVDAPREASGAAHVGP